jgi:hypothetical protein
MGYSIGQMMQQPNLAPSRPDFGADYKQAVITEEDRKRMENNLLIAKEAVVSNPRLSNMTFEDKFYESLGIKKSSGEGWGLQSRPVGRILVAVAVVAGYFAYKKFKK